VAIPFFLIHDAHRALRFSNAVAVTMLFVCGYAWGRLSRYHPWLTGLGMVVVGSALVAMTMALGG
jgi:VIT1/CCC1 family predicted Fe2+/Mn2+ transporter